MNIMLCCPHERVAGEKMPVPVRLGLEFCRVEPGAVIWYHMLNSSAQLRSALHSLMWQHKMLRVVSLSRCCEIFEGS